VTKYALLVVIFGGVILCLVAQLVLFAWIERARTPESRSPQQGGAVEAKSLADPWRQPFLRAGPLRAVIETLLAQTVLLAVLLPLGFAFLSVPSERDAQIEASIILLGGPGCILWCALRLRLPAGRWPRQALYDSAVAVALALFMLPLLIAAALAFLRRETFSLLTLVDEGLQHDASLLRVLLALFVGALGLFLVFRVGVRLWLRWNHMRRTRLRWALTHAHLLVVVLGAGLFGVLAVGVDILTSTEFPFYLLSLLFGLAVFTAIALALVLPPSALFSYLFSRRVVRRIEGLATAASALRKGNYSIRVPVQGEDELARLQTDFNAMAADLERTMRELQEERDAVATLLKARRELIASVSHELRTPVATLRGYLESTRIHWTAAPPPTLRHDLQVMEQETIRLQALIDDLFTLARAEVRKLELRCQPVDLGALARRVAETMAPLAWQSGRVEVVAAVSREIPLALADPARLEQALQNLVHNGIRHTPPGGIVAVQAQAEADALTLQVKDTGEGIAPADLAHIWERFYRAESARACPGSGSGLGLALVKEMTEAMGGSVAVESAPGEGSCFTLRLPKAGREQAPTLFGSRETAPQRPEAKLEAPVASATP